MKSDSSLQNLSSHFQRTTSKFCPISFYSFPKQSYHLGEQVSKHMSLWGAIQSNPIHLIIIPIPLFSPMYVPSHTPTCRKVRVKLLIHSSKWNTAVGAIYMVPPQMFASYDASKLKLCLLWDGCVDPLKYHHILFRGIEMVTQKFSILLSQSCSSCIFLFNILGFSKYGKMCYRCGSAVMSIYFSYTPITWSITTEKASSK